MAQQTWMCLHKWQKQPVAGRKHHKEHGSNKTTKKGWNYSRRSMVLWAKTVTPSSLLKVSVNILHKQTWFYWRNTGHQSLLPVKTISHTRNTGYEAGEYHQRNQASQKRKNKLISAIKLEQTMEVLTKLNDGQKIIKTRSKQLLEPSIKNLSQNSVASQKYDHVFRGRMKCAWVDWKTLLT